MHKPNRKTSQFLRNMANFIYVLRAIIQESKENGQQIHVHLGGYRIIHFSGVRGGALSIENNEDDLSVGTSTYMLQFQLSSTHVKNIIFRPQCVKRASVPLHQLLFT